jgi:hypothetical protein
LSSLGRQSVAEALAALIGGDLSGCDLVAAVPHRELLEAASDRHLVVTRESVIAVLRALLLGAASPSAAQCWASLVRRGYAKLEGPTRPLDIEYDVSAEDEIVEVVGRLDQIGDAVDGTISRSELLDLLLLLGEVDPPSEHDPAG